MMWDYIHERLIDRTGDLYIQAFVIDRLITATEDFLEEEHVNHNYDPREPKNYYRFAFVLNEDEYHADFTNTINGLKVRIHSTHLQQLVYNYEIVYDPTKTSDTCFKWLDKDADKNKYNNLAATKEFVPEEDYPFFEKYTKVIDEIVEKKKEIQELFNVRTNPGQPTASTYVLDDFVHKFEMELSWMKAKKYVSDRISFNDFLKMDIDDLNYNNTIYRLEERDPEMISTLMKHIKDYWMLGKQYRISNVYLNGLFYIENIDLQDVSEAGYDTVDILCSGENAYKVVEIYFKEEDGNEESNKESTGDVCKTED